MKCPKCKTVSLTVTKLDGDLPALGCPNCEGACISLLYYRDWAERTAGESAPQEYSAAVAEVSDSRTAIACPKCSKLMTKFNITGAVSNKLDLCTSCDEAWLDGGEWQLLKALQLSKSIPAVFTDAWQRRVREEGAEIKRRERFTRIIGESEMEKAEQVRQWLRRHPHRAEILFYLGSE